MKEKLVRDHIKALSEKNNDGRKFRTATTEEMPRLLGAKIEEEAKELSEAIANGDTLKIVEELGDIYEVLSKIYQHLQISGAEIYGNRITKARAKGLFENNLVLDLSSNTNDYPKVFDTTRNIHLGYHPDIGVYISSIH